MGVKDRLMVLPANTPVFLIKGPIQLNWRRRRLGRIAAIEAESSL